jgi:hypothetical protein
MPILGKDKTNGVVERGVKIWLKQRDADYIHHVKGIESEVLKTYTFVAYIPSNS